MALNIYSKESVDGLLATKVGEAPVDGYQYVRQNAAWAILTGGGGSATWGSISGDISTQTDLQNEFANYLLLAGGTLTGGLTVSSYGITFSDSSIMTTAPTVFNGGTVNSTVSVTDGTNTTSVTAGGIIFADSTTQTTAFTAGTFLPLSGGAMTGALQLGGDLNCDGYNLSSGNFSSPAGQVNCQNLTLTNGDGGSVTFADGSVQTTAASGGPTTNQAIANMLYGCVQGNFSVAAYLIGLGGYQVYYGKYVSGSSYLIGFGTDASSIGIAYATLVYDPNNNYFGQLSMSTGPGYYLWYSDNGGSTWTASTFTF